MDFLKGKNMDANDLKYFKLIAQIQTTISNSKGLDEALSKSLKLILNNEGADYGIVWYKDVLEGTIIRPYYWISPADLTSRECETGKGIVGKTVSTEKTQKLINYKKGDDVLIDEVFKDINISSVVCVYFKLGDDVIGCLELLKTGGKIFSSDEISIYEIMAMVTELAVLDNSQIKLPYHKNEILLKIDNLKKEFQNGELVTRALKAVNLEIYKGEFVAILGESGCGKSTLLNIIGGLDEATDGSVLFMNQEITNAHQKELTLYRRNNIGFIFQSYNLMDNLTAKENLDLIAELVDNPLDSEKALKLVKLEDKMNSYPSQLSGGQQQRVSIARALIKNPAIILADEPTAALDYETSIEVLSVLNDVIQGGTTLIMVTHNEEITRMADRIIRIRDGRVYEMMINRNKAKAEDLVW